MKAHLSILLLCCALCSKAQQDPQYTQYVFNPLAVNSAYAGSHDALSVAVIAREQWVGLPGRPRTQAASIHMPLNARSVGAGMGVVSDTYGPVRTATLSTDLAIRTQFNDHIRLALGVKGAVTFYHVSLSNLDNTQPDDLAFAQDIGGRAVPNVGASLYLWSAKSYLGVSSPRLVETRLSNTDGLGLDGQERRHLFVYGGTVWGEHRRVQFKPTFQIKAVQGAPLSADLTAQLLFARRLWMGATYRPGAAWGVLTSYQVLDEFSVGYAYDHPTTRLETFQSATHEVALMFHFGFRQHAYTSPRYF